MTDTSFLSAGAPIHAGSGWPRSHRRWSLVALVLLVMLVMLVYWPGLHGGYVFDDYANIVNNTALHVAANATWNQWLAAMFSSPASELQRPLAMLSFAINHALTSLNPYWMKLTNLGIHLFNTWLVFGLVRQILRVANNRASIGGVARADWVALWVAAAWALNPINLTAVLFVVQRMESLSHTFVFAGLWLYMVGRAQLSADGRGWPRMLAGLAGGTTLGLMAKESALLLPLYALALEWVLFGFASYRHVWDRRLFALFAVTLVLPAIGGLAWLLPKVLASSAYAGRAFSLGERLLTETRVLVDYMRWTLIPNLQQLSLYHDDYPVSHGLLSPPATLFCALFLVVLFGAMVWLRKRRPLMALGLAWFFVAHLLTATVVPLELMFEHRNYFASLGLCLAVADGLLLAPISRWRKVGVATAIALLALYAGLTALRAREWQDPMRFSLTEASKHPQSPRATYNVARNFVILSDYRPDSPVISHAFGALDHAMGIPGSTPLPEATAITLAARMGRAIRQEWWNSLQRKLSLRPIGPQETGALASLVACQLKANCPLPAEQMSASFAAALAQGANAEVLNIQGNYALNIQQDPTKALQLWRQAAEVSPRTVQYQATMARMLIATGQFESAAGYISRVRRLGRLGQNEHLARDLERLAAEAKAEGPATEVIRPQDKRQLESAN